VTPQILLPGRRVTAATGLRGDGYATGRRYSQAIARAGGVALQVPPMLESARAATDLMARADGLLLQGGGDVDPSKYGGTTTSDHLYGIDGLHDDLEISLVHAAIALDRPILGICRGVQVLNVALGGSLLPDLGARIPDRESHWDTYHPVTVTIGSRLSEAVGAAPTRSHSYHHQALDRVAEDLDVVATAPDGVIEAVEHRRCRWVVGVQWHPEDDAEDAPGQQSIFDHFVAASRRPTT